MEETVLRASHFYKSYKKAEVLHDLSFDVKKGHICGLIGPNGAGKTTALKILGGLMFPDKGDVELFGKGTELDESRARMSFMIEQPIISINMTARENLQYIRYLRGYPDEKRIDEVLDIVGLADTGKKTAQKFSLGMKQRLGIGMALLPKPEILVLDEPVNGLDPQGMADVRHLLRRLCDEQGVTVLISSHLLSELSEMCDDFVIINGGRLIDSFSHEELLIKCRGHISLKTTDVGRTAAVLEEKLHIHDYKVVHGDEIHIFEHLDSIELISEAVTKSGLVITRLCEEGQSLEEYYIEKVGGING